MREGLEARYDYAAKSIIRDHWVPFAAQGLAPEVIKKLRVWFLPGPEALEAPHYRRAKLRLEQLLGFEWSRDRAEVIRRSFPSLPLEIRALRSFLEDREHEALVPDWANLDFDGSVMTFDFEIRETLRRLRLEQAPALGLSSLGLRDRAALIECIKALSFWAAILPERFDTGLDLLRRGNERSGLVASEPVPTYMLCRELAASLLLVRSFGERSYGRDDEERARQFAAAWEIADQSLDQHIRQEIERGLNEPKPLPVLAVRGLRELVANRMIPVGLTDRLRFVYQSLEHKWRWTWYYRFREQEPVSLLSWAEKFFLEHPPLHHIDFTGAVVGARRTGVCQFCKGKET